MKEAYIVLSVVFDGGLLLLLLFVVGEIATGTDISRRWVRLMYWGIAVLALVLAMAECDFVQRCDASTTPPGTLITLTATSGDNATACTLVVTNPLSNEKRPVFAPQGLVRTWTDKAGSHSYTDWALAGWWVRVPVVRVTPGVELCELTGVMLRDGRIWTRRWGVVDPSQLQ